MNNSNEQHSYTLADILGAPLSKEEILKLLQADSGTYDAYQHFKDEHSQEYQEKLLDFLRGKHGLCITYDTFFKKIMNPIEKRERLEKFLPF